MNPGPLPRRRRGLRFGLRTSAASGRGKWAMASGSGRIVVGCVCGDCRGPFSIGPRESELIELAANIALNTSTIAAVAWRELTELMNVAPLLQRQVFMLDGATDLPALGAGLVRTGMPDGLGSTNSCEDRDRLLLLADTEEVVEATQPSGARLNPLGIPRGCSLQRSSSTSARPLFEP